MQFAQNISNTQVYRDTIGWISIATFVGFVIFLDPLIQTTTCQGIDHCICHRHRGERDKKVTATDFCQNLAS